MKPKILLSTFAAALALMGTANAATVVLIDPSFESAFSGSAGNVGSGWFTFAPTINEARSGEPLGPGSFWGPIANLDGANGGFLTSNHVSDGASAYQAVSLTAGESYQFTVSLGTSSAVAKQDALYGVVVFDTSFGSQIAGNFGSIAADGDVFSDYTLSFSVPTDGVYHVGIRNLGYVPGTGLDGAQDNSLIVFDNARLIPEPSTAALLGLSALGLLRRRR